MILTQNNKGFTLIELILVLAILAILAVTAMPKIFSLTNEAQAAARDGLVGSVQSAIQMYGVQYELGITPRQYPMSLDAGIPPGDNCMTGAGCFWVVLKDKLAEEANWDKTNWNDYRHKPTSTIYRYDNMAGTFKKL